MYVNIFFTHNYQLEKHLFIKFSTLGNLIDFSVLGTVYKLEFCSKEQNTIPIDIKINNCISFILNQNISYKFCICPKKNGVFKYVPTNKDWSEV